ILCQYVIISNANVFCSIVQNSIIQTSSELNNVNIKNSMIGNFVKYENAAKDVSIGDYNVLT
ncbi:MAG: nucleotidyltransferase, partial [Bacteroidota bacterium]